MKIHCVSLDVYKKYVKKGGVLTFGRNLLWEGQWKESLLWVGLSVRGTFALTIVALEGPKHICDYYNSV